MKIIGYAILIPIVSVYESLIFGLVLKKLWAWFVVTMFEMPPVTVAEALGIGLIVGFLTHQYRYQKDAPKMWEIIIYSLTVSTGRAAAALVAGFICHHFI